MTRQPFILRNPSILIVLAVLAIFTVAVTLLSQAYRARLPLPRRIATTSIFLPRPRSTASPDCARWPAS